MTTGNINVFPSTFKQLPDVRVVRKAADEIVNNSAVLQNDNELLFAVAANEIWEITVLIAAVSATNAPDIKFALVGPAGAAGWSHSLGFNGGAANPLFYTGALGGNHPADADTTQRLYLVKGIIVNGAAAGNITLQWAQLVAVVEDTTVLANSCLIAHRLN